MDKETRSKLEDIRPRVSRYLFRAWNNTPGGAERVSGGFEGLNTPEAITPLGFFHQTGSENAYDLSKERFADMALDHLCGCSGKTEFSSWASSLAFALGHIAGDDLGCQLNKASRNCVYISVIDTKELWDTNQIFWVPDLAFLDPDMRSYPHEYLAHGVITGAAHKALPVQVFCDLGVDLDRSTRFQFTFKISSESVRTARRIGDHYGGDFALPMCLAVLCRKQRDPKFFREGVEELDKILAGISDLLPVPQKWANDKATQRDAEYVKGYEDVEQMCRLMRALLELPKANERRKENLWDDIERAGEARQIASMKRKRAIREAAMESDQERNEEEVKKAEEESARKRMKRLDREMKRLEIDMAH